MCEQILSFISDEAIIDEKLSQILWWIIFLNNYRIVLIKYFSNLDDKSDTESGMKYVNFCISPQNHLKLNLKSYRQTKPKKTSHLSKI